MGQPPDDDPWLIDFFDEGETHENAPSDGEAAEESEWFAAEPRAVGRRRRPRIDIDPSSRVQQLAVAVVAVLAVTVVVAFATRGGSEASADSSYFAKLSVPAQDSQSVGTALTTLLGNALAAPASMKQFESSLGDLVSRQTQDTSETLAIAAPPQLRSEQQQAVTAMEFRRDGLVGLLKGFRNAVAHPNEANWSPLLAVQAESLITSDVIWRDLFLTQTRQQLRTSGVTGAAPPRSVFVTNADLLSATDMKQVLERGTAASSSSSSTVVTSPTAVLQLGDTGPAVSAWQTDLNKWIGHQTGIPLLTVNGTFDAQTESATKDLQTAEQITVDGVVGPVTRSALQTALSQSG